MAFTFFLKIELWNIDYKNQLLSKGDYFFWESLWEFSGFVFPQMWQIIGNKVKGQISKRVFQENKARQIFRKRTFLTTRYPHVCAYQGVSNVPFSENLTCFVFLKHPFWDSLFCLITDEMRHTVNSLISLISVYSSTV